MLVRVVVVVLPKEASPCVRGGPVWGASSELIVPTSTTTTTLHGSELVVLAVVAAAPDTFVVVVLRVVGHAVIATSVV